MVAKPVIDVLVSVADVSDEAGYRPAVAVDYSRLKQRLAAEFTGDRVRYTAAKGGFIADVLDRAEAWAATSGWSVAP